MDTGDFSLGLDRVRFFFLAIGPILTVDGPGYRLPTRSGSKVVAAGRRVEVENRTHRHDPCGVDSRVGDVVVTLDLIEVDGLADAGVLVELAQVAGQVFVVGDSPLVALEVADIDGIKTDQSDEKPPVRSDIPRC